jgi:aminoglycoside phosphotransferase (APT) family kinase protein
VPDAIPTRQQLELSLARFRSDVLPLLPQREAGPARDLLTRLATPPPVTALVHGDLGPAHVLTFGSVVSGVIDWSDAHVGDPALDLAWLVHGSGQGEVAAVAYGATAALVDRARDWHLLGPWHEVTYGLDEGRPDLVASGITGVRARLVAH